MMIHIMQWPNMRKKIQIYICNIIEIYSELNRNIQFILRSKNLIKKAILYCNCLEMDLINYLQKRRIKRHHSIYSLKMKENKRPHHHLQEV